MATYNELANTYATNAKNEYLNSLSYLTDDLAAQNKLNQEALTQKYNNLFDQINRQQDVVNQQYSQDAKSAYLNKLLAGRALDESLSQLGLSTGGFGVNQRLANETAYGQNLAALQKVRSEELRDIANQLTDAYSEYNVANTQLGSDYLAQLLAAKTQQQNMADERYQLAYNQYLADLKYQDELKQYQEQFAYQKEQDKIANDLKRAQINASKSGGSGGNSLGTYAKSRLSGLQKTYGDVLSNPDNHGYADAVDAIITKLQADADAGMLSEYEWKYILNMMGIRQGSLTSTTNTTGGDLTPQQKEELKQYTSQNPFSSIQTTSPLTQPKSNSSSSKPTLNYSTHPPLNVTNYSNIYDMLNINPLTRHKSITNK